MKFLHCSKEANFAWDSIQDERAEKKNVLGNVIKARLYTQWFIHYQKRRRGGQVESDFSQIKSLSLSPRIIHVETNLVLDSTI